jgi:hypothetical protein
MKNLLNGVLISGIVMVALLSSCNDPETPETKLPYEQGVFVANEGVFQTGTGSISFFSRDSLQVIKEVFQTVNNRPVGNVLTDVEVYGDNAYLVVNNAQKVEVVSYKDFKSIGVITGFNLPSKFLPISDTKAYVSQWGVTGLDGSVEVVDLSTFSVTKSIPTGAGPGKMLKSGDKVYVTNKGGYGNDSNLTVINTATDVVEEQLFVGYNPESIVEDKNGMIWVLCNGKWKSDWSGLEHPGKLVKIDPATNTILASVDFSSTFSTPTDLEINKEKTQLFFLYSGGVYSMDVDATSIDNTAFIDKAFYSIGFDETANMLYCGDAKDYVSNGKVYRYNTSGTLVDSFETGIIPTEYFFN